MPTEKMMKVSMFPKVANLSIWVVVSFGLVLRVLWALFVQVDPTSDSAAYEVFATNIVEHGVYGFTPDKPSAYWAVGTSGIYAFGYMVFGTGSALSVVILNLFSAVIVIWALFDLGSRWFSHAAGLWAAILFAIWPITIQFTTVLASEVHFMALSLLALSAWDRSSQSLRGVGFVIAAGLCLGAATYVRPIALLIPAALAIASLLRTFRIPWWDLLKAALTTVMIFAIVSPWSARNERIFDEPVFMSTNFWPNFWMGNHPDTNGGYTPLPEATQEMTETERAAYMKDLAIADLEAAPFAFVWRTVWKSVRLYERETIGVGWNEKALKDHIGSTGITLMKAVSTGFLYLAMIVAIFGVVLLWRSELGWTTVVTPSVWLFLYFTAIHAVIVIGDRYHMPAIPMIALLAGVALGGLGKRPSDQGVL